LLRVPRLPEGQWVWKKMLRMPRRSVPNGSFIPLHAKDGRLIARGFLNRQSEIAFRILCGPEGEADFEALLSQRLRAAMELRRDVLKLPQRTNAFRMVHAEGDRLSGLVIDRYADTAVVLVHSIGWVANAELLEQLLRTVTGVTRVLFRADDHAAKLEGFTMPAIAAGTKVEIHEDGLHYQVDFAEGHKSGLFLDQRDQRARMAALAPGRNVLDLCCNAGGFSLAAAKAGAASVTGLDLDEKAVAAAEQNARRNKLRVNWVHADLFPWLRQFLATDKRMDLVILDPPKLARGRDEVARALDTYQDMNALALRALRPGGLFQTFSCSGAVREDDFLAMLQASARTAARAVQVLEITGAAPDHPVALETPESRYLKGFLCRVH
jgi:23S rRNA (cytosine1962-C5)-methyltransferase